MNAKVLVSGAHLPPDGGVNSPSNAVSVEDVLRARGVPMRVSVNDACVALSAALLATHASIERVALDDALGRRLAEDIHIAHALPPFANSAMDGYAFRHADLQGLAVTSLSCIGESRAGLRFMGYLNDGQCVRIATGAALPQGADTVVIQEEVTRAGDLITLAQVPRSGANVRLAGEECAAGSRVLSREMSLDARALALAATAGRSELRVYSRPRVAIVTTGDELTVPGQPLAPGQIYDSNASMLHALITECGGHPLPPAQASADDPQRLLHALRRAAAAADLVLTTGGASVGDHDHLPRLLTEHGCVHFWKVRMKPGMPALFGELAGKPVLALPGNPVSVFVSFRVLARTAIAALQSCPPAELVSWRARLSQPLRKTHARAEYLRAVYRIDANGQLWVRPLSAQESHRSLGLLQASVLLRLGEGEVELQQGAMVDVEPLFPALHGELPS
jgi:molybdopterin molybdotransferase